MITPSFKFLLKATTSTLLASSALLAVLPARADVVWADWTVTKSTPPGTVVAGAELATFDGLSQTAIFAGPLKPNAVSAAAASGAAGTAAGSRVSFNTESGTRTITFSQAVTNPLLAIWGLETGNSFNTYDFFQTPTLVSGSQFSIAGNRLSGGKTSGADGVVQFLGTYTQLSWTNQCDEDSYLSVGLNVAAVPEPQTYALMIAGLGMLGWVGRRQRAVANRHAPA